MLLRLAWRNIWRNKRRSVIVIASIVVGLSAILLYSSLSVGFLYQMIDNQIGSQTSHIQIHRKGFVDNKIIQNYLPNAARVEAALRSVPEVQHFSRRVVTFGLLSSPYGSSGVNIIGVVPAEETHVSNIRRSMVKGEYLSGAMREIIIGDRLAEKLNVELGDKVVAMASTLDGKVGADVFRIVGLFQTSISEFDKTTIYVSLANAQEMLNLGDHLSEFAIILNQRQSLQVAQKSLIERLDESYEVLTYADLMPLILMQMEAYEEWAFIIYLIVGVAMIFGIVNTMLMSVFERIQEIGVLMAVGMRNRTLFGMIMLEAFILGVFGTLLGMAVGLLIYWPLSHTGVDLSIFAESLASFGVAAVIYPALTTADLVSAATVIPMVTVLGAMYPAFRAIRLQPTNAMRYV